MQYIGKGEAAFNNHWKDTKKPNSILTFKHFQEQGHNLHSSKSLDLLKNLAVKRTFMLLPFCLISTSLKQLSRDITNDIKVKQNIFDVM